MRFYLTPHSLDAVTRHVLDAWVDPACQAPVLLQETTVPNK